MRTIKFRAWDNEFNEMNTPECRDIFIELSGYCRTGAIKGNFTLLQYTELKDKNDTEIYEGDIVMLREGRICVIRYEPDCGGYIAHWAWSKNQHHVELTCDVACECDVIGNIYQNKELIP